MNIRYEIIRAMSKAPMAYESYEHLITIMRNVVKVDLYLNMNKEIFRSSDDCLLDQEQKERYFCKAESCS